MAIIMTDVDSEEKVSFYPKEMKELFNFIEPYMDRCCLREYVPEEAYEAFEKLKELALHMGQ